MLNKGPTHGQYNHPYFRRWSSLIQRCYNPNSTHFAAYGGLGIMVDWDWNCLNPDGAANFLTWADREVKLWHNKHPEYMEKKFEIGRKDVTKNYGPTNCQIVLRGATTRMRRTSACDFDTVVAMRRHKRLNPDVTLAQMEKLFDICGATISRALRGVNWSICDVVEPPIKMYGSETECTKKKVKEPILVTA